MTVDEIGTPLETTCQQSVNVPEEDTEVRGVGWLSSPCSANQISVVVAAVCCFAEDISHGLMWSGLRLALSRNTKLMLVAPVNQAGTCRRWCRGCTVEHLTSQPGRHNRPGRNDLPNPDFDDHLTLLRCLERSGSGCSCRTRRMIRSPHPVQWRAELAGSAGHPVEGTSREYCHLVQELERISVSYWLRLIH